MHPRITALLFPLALALACGTSSGDAASTATDETSGGAAETGSSSGGATTGSPGAVDVDALASCVETDLEVIPFIGPAFDPETGALLEPLPTPHIVATTAGWPLEGAEHWSALEKYTTYVIMRMFPTDGLLGASFSTSEVCGSARTLSVWRDEASLQKFVYSSPHAEVIADGLEHNKAWETTHWTETSSTAAPTWEAGRAALDAVRKP